MDYRRSAPVIKPEDVRDVPVTIVGVGAIGSRIFAGLIELGFRNISVWDFDVVEAHNLPNQLFGVQDIGIPKVHALTNWLLFKMGEVPETLLFHNKPYEYHGQEDGLIFMCVDSLDTRRSLINEWELYNGTIIDCRLGSSFGNVFTFTKNEFETYLGSLNIDPDLIEVSACGSALSVSPSASIISNMAVWQGVKALKGHEPEYRIDLFIDPVTTLYSQTA